MASSRHSSCPFPLCLSCSIAHLLQVLQKQEKTYASQQFRQAINVIFELFRRMDRNYNQQYLYSGQNVNANPNVGLYNAQYQPLNNNISSDVRLQGP